MDARRIIRAPLFVFTDAANTTVTITTATTTTETSTITTTTITTCATYRGCNGKRFERITGIDPADIVCSRLTKKGNCMRRTCCRTKMKPGEECRDLRKRSHCWLAPPELSCGWRAEIAACITVCGRQKTADACLDVPGCSWLRKPTASVCRTDRCPARSTRKRCDAAGAECRWVPDNDRCSVDLCKSRTKVSCGTSLMNSQCRWDDIMQACVHRDT